MFEIWGSLSLAIRQWHKCTSIYALICDGHPEINKDMHSTLSPSQLVINNSPPPPVKLMYYCNILSKISATVQSHHKSLLPIILLFLDKCIKRFCKLTESKKLGMCTLQYSNISVPVFQGTANVLWKFFMGYLRHTNINLLSNEHIHTQWTYILHSCIKMSAIEKQLWMYT